MTSANLSFSDKVKNQKKYVTGTLWTSLVAFPFVFAYFVLGVIMMISRSINYYRLYNQTDAVLAMEKCRAVSRIMGLDSITFMLVMLIAVVFAFQGFSYLFSQSRIDFYLSQPTTRVQRIKKTYVSAFLTYLTMFGISELIALIIAACMGAINEQVLVSVLVEFVRNIVLYFAVYNVTVVAIMLCGTYVSAILVTGLFAFASIVIAVELDFFKSLFYATYSYSSKMNVYLSPVFDRFSSLFAFNSRFGGLSSNKMIENMSILQDRILSNLRFEIDTLLVAVIAFILVLLISSKRKAEMAGKSIAFRPFRWFVKVTICVIVGLGAAYLVYIMYENVWNKKLCMLMCFIMILGTILAGCIFEVIIDTNIRRFFKGIPQTIMAIAIVLLIFVIFKGDLLGYDSYIPNPEKVESCAIIDYYGEFNVWSNEDNDFVESEVNHMYITNVNDFIQIAKLGMDNSREAARNGEDRHSYAEGYDVTILYRMKNGKNIYRSVVLPFDVDPELMDKILSSEEYLKGRFDVFFDDELRFSDSTNSKNRIVRYNTINETLITTDLPYEELSDALREDILNGFSYSYMRDHRPIASIEYSNDGTYYVDANIPVYENYEKTIALMKKYGIYSDPELDVSEITSIEVTNYYPGYDLSVTDIDDVPSDLDSLSAKYTDPDQIKEICEKAYFRDFLSYWTDYRNLCGQYTVIVSRNGETPSSNYGSYGQYMYFDYGNVPEFVVKDTNN